VLILVRVNQAPEVVEQKCDPVAPDLKGVESTLEAGEGGELPLQLESGMRDAVGVLGHDFETDCTKQIGAKGLDVPVGVSGLSVGMLGDDGRIVRRKRRNEGVFEARLVKNLVAKAGDRGRRKEGMLLFPESGPKANELSGERFR
jgi:hypothetical protein